MVALNKKAHEVSHLLSMDGQAAAADSRQQAAGSCTCSKRREPHEDRSWLPRLWKRQMLMNGNTIAKDKRRQF